MSLDKKAEPAFPDVGQKLSFSADVAIAAPFEQISDGSRGAVYIYMGSPTGLRSAGTKPIQRITSQTLPGVGDLQGLGFSLTSSWDFDENGFGG